MRLLALIPLLCFLTGCAHYEYDLVQPPGLRRHIATKTDTVVTLDPLEYRLRTVENRLVMRIFNPTDEPVQLLGDKSAVVDPSGQGHPLRSQAIVPHSFVKFVFPPLRPRVYDPGPTFGIGIGTRIGRAYGPGYYPPFDEPRYFYVVDDDNRYWDWDGQTDVRVTLVYQRADKQFKHEMTFHRVKT